MSVMPSIEVRFLDLRARAQRVAFDRGQIDTFVEFGRG